jgi:transposase
LHITVQQNIELNVPSASVLAVDFGERHIATSVEYANGKMQNPRFYGTEVRGIRRHYAWLRKRLGNKKALKTIKKIGHKEKRKVNAVLHGISRAISSIDSKPQLEAAANRTILRRVRAFFEGFHMAKLVNLKLDEIVVGEGIRKT